eukprot:348029_1
MTRIIIMMIIKKLKTFNHNQCFFKEIEWVNAQHVVLLLYDKLDQYLKYKPGRNKKGMVIEKMKRNEYGNKLYDKLDQYLKYKPGRNKKGMVIEKMKRNEYGNKLYVQYGFNEEWFVESVDGCKMNDAEQKDIEDILKHMEVDKGYEVVFKAKSKTSAKKPKQMKAVKDWADLSQSLLTDQTLRNDDLMFVCVRLVPFFDEIICTVK